VPDDAVLYGVLLLRDPCVLSSGARAAARGARGVSLFRIVLSDTCDTFRQELRVTRRESWADLEAFCVPIVEKHWRACKNRSKVVGDSVGCLRVNEALALSMPF
jgi:hypothetical protein